MKELSFKFFTFVLLSASNALYCQGFAFKSTYFELEKQGLFIMEKSTNSTLKLNTSPPFDLYNFAEIQTILNEKKSYRVLPIFCKMEALVYKSSKINLRINLGSNEYVRMLEGKPN